MQRLADVLASRHLDRIVIFDTPPLLGAPEPAVLASHMGQVIVVVEAGKTKRKVLGNALATIESCPLVATVLNKSTSVEAGYHYYEAASTDG
jgi:receptor protein-tyrosine kinase